MIDELNFFRKEKKEFFLIIVRVYFSVIRYRYIYVCVSNRAY